MIGAYLDMMRIRFLMMLAYRTNYYSGIVVYALNIGTYYFLWQAIYGGRETLAGMTAEQMTSYVAVTWMARAFYFNNLDREIAQDIRDGGVAVQLIRPYHYLMAKFMQGLGEGIFRLLLFSAPGMLIVSFIFPIQFPKDPVIWAVFLLMLLFSFLINSQINILTGLFAFFVENNEGMMRMKRVAVDLFSGLIIPLSFFPGWAEVLLKVLPFQAVTYLPGSVFTGKIGPELIASVLAVQVFWTLLLLVPILWVWRAARRRLFVQGG
ncbi:ABC transporter permease [Ferviditalea candida]|uniref:ABC-2 family transporter protein n=1 Tax=Ferviditalea candida TaxID=3108399 RepID=A0ABU5ZN10_9BACL|nr:ABC-2 family transporter protein [Paenibacillaceae bacterium T2]